MLREPRRSRQGLRIEDAPPVGTDPELTSRTQGQMDAARDGHAIRGTGN